MNPFLTMNNSVHHSHHSVQQFLHPTSTGSSPGSLSHPHLHPHHHHLQGGLGVNKPMELLQESQNAPNGPNGSSSSHHFQSNHLALLHPSLLVPSAAAAAAAAAAAGLHHHHHHHHPYNQSTSSHHHHHKSESSSNQSSNTNQTGKVKRARQRVDAGEPRNSYASITNFSSTRSSAFHSSVNSRLSSTLHNDLVNCKSTGNNNTKSASSCSSSSSSSYFSKSPSSSSSSSSYAQLPTAHSSSSMCPSNQPNNLSSITSSSSSLPGSGGSASLIGVQFNDKMTSQYKENNINCKKSGDNQLMSGNVASLISNSNVVFGVHGVGSSSSSIMSNNNNNNNNNNSVNNSTNNLGSLNSMYHNGRSTSQFVYGNNYDENNSKQQQQNSPSISFSSTSPVTSPSLINDNLSSLTNATSSCTKESIKESTNESKEFIKESTSKGSTCFSSVSPTRHHSSSSSSCSTESDTLVQSEETGSLGANSSAHLLRVILQKGKRGGNNNEITNCDKSGSTTCEANNGSNDGETDSGRNFSGSPVNNSKGGDEVDDDDNNNKKMQKKKEKNKKKNNNNNNDLVDELDDDEVNDDDNEDDDDDDVVEASCSVDSEGEPDGDDYNSGRPGKVDRFDLDIDEYNMSHNNDDESKNEGEHEKSEQPKEDETSKLSDKLINDGQTNLTGLSSLTSTQINESNLPLQLTSESSNREQSNSSSCSSSTNNPSSVPNSGPTISDVKRARVENIVTNMLPRSNSISGQSSNKSEDQIVGSTCSSLVTTSTSSATLAIVNGCKKRKLYHPQQSKSNGSLDDEDDEEDDDDLLGEIVDEVHEDEGEEDEMNDSIGLSNAGEFEMTEINDLSIKSSVKCEVGDKSDLDESIKGSNVNQDEAVSTLMNKYKNYLEPNNRKDLTKSKLSNPFNLSRTRKSQSKHQTGDLDEDELASIMDDDFIVNDDEEFSEVRSTPQITSGSRFGLQDPGQLLSEARKLVYQQEKMSKNHNSDSHRSSNKSNRRSISTCLPNSSINGLSLPVIVESNAIPPSPPLHYSDIEWLSDTLKAEMQANLIPSLNTIIDSVISRFCQRRAAAAAAASTSSSVSRSNQLGNLILPHQPDLVAPESSKELTLLSQMLESKSPRTSHGKPESSSQQSQSHSTHHKTSNVPRGSPSSSSTTTSNHHHHHHSSHHHSSHQRQSSTPINQINTGSTKSPINGHPNQPQQQHHHHSHHHHRVSSSSPSSFTLPTESAPVPKPPGPSPFAFPPGFKPNFLFPNFPSGLPGAAAAAAAAAASQTPPNLLHAASIAQHLNSFASVFQQQQHQHHHHQQQQHQQQHQLAQQQLQSLRSSGSDVLGPNDNGLAAISSVRDQSTPISTPTGSLSFLGGRDNQSSSAREGSPVDSEHRNSVLGDISLSDLASGGEQTEAMSLVVTPKRKRHKVTDSRITPRTVSRILNQEPLLANLIARGELSSPPPALSFGLNPHNGPSIGPPTAPPPPLVPVSLPTSVAMSNPGLHSAELFGSPSFPFSDHARLLRESLFCQAAAAAAAASSGGVQGSASEVESKERENKSINETQNDAQSASQQQQKQQQQSQLNEQDQEQDEQDEFQQSQQLQRDSESRQQQRHHHHHHHQAQQQQAAAVAAAAAAAAVKQHHHHANVAAIQNALAANHLAMLAQANRAAGGGDTASPESLSQFGGTRSENGADGSESLNDSTGYDTSTPLLSFCGNSIPLQTTLSSMHLRKAKLMFFYVRYPSSNVLKTFFPDIKFNKNNTAQLVKWFSNFREFYYIQMEKYARQAIAEGIKSADEIHIHKESELLRVLNMHYNRSNHLEVPERFCYVVEQTLKEFFKSILAGKDSEQSWKKAIYKIISRLDDSVPEYFKSPTFLGRLE